MSDRRSGGRGDVIALQNRRDEAGFTARVLLFGPALHVASTALTKREAERWVCHGDCRADFARELVAAYRFERSRLDVADRTAGALGERAEQRQLQERPPPGGM